MTAGGHRLMEQRGVLVAGTDEIKMQTDVAQEDLARRSRSRQQLQGLPVEFAEMVLQHRLVETLLATEIIVEQGLVDSSFDGDGIGAGAGESPFGKNRFRRSQDGAASSRAAFGAGRFCGGRHNVLTNRIVNYGKKIGLST